MYAMIIVLFAMLIIATCVAWAKVGEVIELRSAYSRAQAEIRALEDKLRELNHGE